MKKKKKQGREDGIHAVRSVVEHEGMRADITQLQPPWCCVVFFAKWCAYTWALAKIKPLGGTRERRTCYDMFVHQKQGDFLSLHLN